MSGSPHRVWSRRVMNVFVSTAMLIAGACHPAQSTPPQPSAVEPSDRSFPGVDIVRTASSGFLIRVRSGMVGNGEPLYVIDGEPMRIEPNRGIDWFPPEAIADIKVLKSPVELAEYGPSGANGVIVITTKRAPRHRR
jgi:TonB-dependent SusC/RagA subfamily outer membrane receptor